MSGRIPSIDAWSMLVVEDVLEPLWQGLNAALDWLADLVLRGFAALRSRREARTKPRVDGRD